MNKETLGSSIPRGAMPPPLVILASGPTSGAMGRDSRKRSA